jgi:hypothetical protein
MAELDPEIKKVAIVDPRIDQERPTWAVEKGAASISSVVYPSTGGTANSSLLSFTINPPGGYHTYTDRWIRINADIYLTLSPTVAGPPAVGAPYILPGRDFTVLSNPLMSLVSQVTGFVNDVSVSLDNFNLMRILERLIDRRSNRPLFSGPFGVERYFNLQDSVGAIGSTLANYASAVDDESVPPGSSFQVRFCDANGNVLSGNGTFTGAGGVVVSFTNSVPTYTVAGGLTPPLYLKISASEALPVAPLIASPDAEFTTGLSEITSMQFQLQLQTPQAANLIQWATSAQLTNLAYGWSTGAVSNARLTCRHLTPQIDQPRPEYNVLPYQWFKTSVTQAQAVPQGSSTVFTISNVIWDSVPDLIILAARPAPGALGANESAQAMMPITNISIQSGNQPNLMSSDAPETLFSESRRWGLNSCDFNQFMGQAYSSTPVAGQFGLRPLTSAPVVLKPGSSYPLGVEQAAGMMEPYNWSAQVTVSNPLHANINCTVTCVAVFSGYLVSRGGSSRVISKILDAKEVLEAPKIHATRGILSRLVGSGAFAGLSNGYGRVHKMLFDRGRDEAAAPASAAAAMTMVRRARKSAKDEGGARSGAGLAARFKGKGTSHA